MPFGAPFQLLGMALDLILEALGISWAWLGSGMARGPQNGLDCTGARAGALFYQDPGIQGTAKVEGGFDPSGPYCQLFNCLKR